jgi:hypothetical protein
MIWRCAGWTMWTDCWMGRDGLLDEAARAGVAKCRGRARQLTRSAAGRTGRCGSQEFWLLRVVNPARSYRLNADIEDHAEHEYAALIAEHPEWEDVPFNSVVASGYTAYESLADLFRQIGSDEGVHKEMSLARISRAGKSC